MECNCNKNSTPEKTKVELHTKIQDLSIKITKCQGPVGIVEKVINHLEPSVVSKVEIEI